MFVSVIAPLTRWGSPAPSSRRIVTVPVPALIRAPCAMVMTETGGVASGCAPPALAVSVIGPFAVAKLPFSRIERPALRLMDCPPSPPVAEPSPSTSSVPRVSSWIAVVLAATGALPMMPPAPVRTRRSPSKRPRMALVTLKLPPWATICERTPEARLPRAEANSSPAVTFPLATVISTWPATLPAAAVLNTPSDTITRRLVVICVRPPGATVSDETPPIAVPAPLVLALLNTPRVVASISEAPCTATWAVFARAVPPMPPADWLIAPAPDSIVNSPALIAAFVNSSSAVRAVASPTWLPSPPTANDRTLSLASALLSA